MHRLAGEKAVDQVKRRCHQKGTEDVRVLKSAFCAVVKSEDLKTRNGVEISDDAEQRCDQRCRKPGPENQKQPLVLVLHDRRIKNRGQRQEGRDGEIERSLIQIGHGGERKITADIKGKQQAQKQDDGARKAKAKQEPHGHLSHHHQFIRGRFGDDEAGKEHAEGDEERSDEPHGGQRCVEIRRVLVTGVGQ
ncbi:hypothetical protein D3C72_1076550 [compost metagenome]